MKTILLAMSVLFATNSFAGTTDVGSSNSGMSLAKCSVQERGQFGIAKQGIVLNLKSDETGSNFAGSNKLALKSLPGTLSIDAEFHVNAGEAATNRSLSKVSVTSESFTGSSWNGNVALSSTDSLGQKSALSVDCKLVK